LFKRRPGISHLQNGKTRWPFLQPL